MKAKRVFAETPPLVSCYGVHLLFRCTTPSLRLLKPPTDDSLGCFFDVSLIPSAQNLPFVQEFLHRLLGPFYEWVDQWQMGARLGYLGTMLFLQNFQKALRAAQGIARSLQYLGSVAFRPVAVPLGLAAELFRPIGGALWGFASEAGAFFAGVGFGVLAEVWYAAAYVVSPVVGFARLTLMTG